MNPKKEEGGGVRKKKREEKKTRRHRIANINMKVNLAGEEEKRSCAKPLSNFCQKREASVTRSWSIGKRRRAPGEGGKKTVGGKKGTPHRERLTGGKEAVLLFGRKREKGECIGKKDYRKTKVSCRWRTKGIQKGGPPQNKG